MILLAHIWMMPVEEIVVPLATGVGAGTALWIAAFLSPLRSKLRQ
jgi:hypothetical protein